MTKWIKNEKKWHCWEKMKKMKKNEKNDDLTACKQKILIIIVIILFVKEL